MLKIHDALIRDVEYDENAYSGEEAEISHSIAGAMTSAKTAVCEGYAKVMQLMMNCYDVENMYVTGIANGGGHAWNMVRMNDGNITGWMQHGMIRSMKISNILIF